MQAIRAEGSPVQQERKNLNSEAGPSLHASYQQLLLKLQFSGLNPFFPFIRQVTAWN